MGRPFRSLQQLINIIEVDAGPGVQGLRPNLERPRRFDESRTDRGPKRVVHRLFQRAPASVGGLLDPPVGVIGFVDIFDRPAEAGEVLEPLVLHGFTNTVVRHDLDRAAGKTVAAHGEIMPDETLGTPLISYLNSSSASTVAFLMQSGTE